MKFHVFAVLVALSLVSLSACGGGNASGGLLAVPAAHAIVPFVKNTVQVTAVKGGSPISGLKLSLTRTNWPGGKLIAKGNTGMHGRIKLSGDWTDKELICVGGRLNLPSGYEERSKCEQPFPKDITLRF